MPGCTVSGLGCIVGMGIACIIGLGPVCTAWCCTIGGCCVDGNIIGEGPGAGLIVIVMGTCPPACACAIGIIAALDHMAFNERCPPQQGGNELNRSMFFGRGMPGQKEVYGGYHICSSTQRVWFSLDLNY